MTSPSGQAVRAHAEKSIFGNPIVDNRFRPLLVEAIVDLFTSDDWHWCAGNWSGHDFEHLPTGTKLEVKQSAAKQTWHDENSKFSKLSFDIRKRKGFYVGNIFQEFEAPKRVADLYLFAAHTRTDLSSDHQDPSQWQFYLAREADLPDRVAIHLEWIQKKPYPTLSYTEIDSALMAMIA